MASSFGLLGFLFLILFVVSMWIGVIALRKVSKLSGARLMFVGCCITSIGLVSLLATGLVLVMRMDFSMGLLIPVQLLNLSSVLGLLIFIVGFALHGMQVRRVHERLGELESIIEAQQEQLALYEAKV